MNSQMRRWQAWGGYFIDILRLAKGETINPHSYLKFLRLKRLGERLGAVTLIETGTYLGVTAYRSSFSFDHVYTIEVGKDLADRAKAFLRNRSNVSVINGDAVSILLDIFENQKQLSSVLLFLDAHYSGPSTAAGVELEPALQELSVLSRFKELIAGIVIDDFRSFGTEAGFPTKSELLGAVERLFPSYDIAVGFDQVTVTKRKSFERNK